MSADVSRTVLVASTNSQQAAPIPILPSPQRCAPDDLLLHFRPSMPASLHAYRLTSLRTRSLRTSRKAHVSSPAPIRDSESEQSSANAILPVQTITWSLLLREREIPAMPLFENLGYYLRLIRCSVFQRPQRFEVSELSGGKGRFAIVTGGKSGCR